MDAATRFIAAACRWPPTPESAGVVASEATAVTDWSAVEAALRRHRVAPLVAKNLAAYSGDSPDPSSRPPHTPPRTPPWHAISATLASAGRQGAIKSLRGARETRHLITALETASLSPLTFKGASLEERIFGQRGLKQSRDIDLYVPQAQAARAIETLEADGYLCATARAPLPKRLRTALIHTQKDITLLKPGHLPVEVHWRLTTLPGLLPGFEARLGRQEVMLDGLGPLPTLGDAALFCYLCVHGAHHDWARLKWLADVAALWGQFGPDARASALGFARRLGGAMAVAQALELARDLMGTALTAEEHRILGPIPESRRARLVAHAEAEIAAPYSREMEEGRARDARVIGAWWTHRLLYLPAWRAPLMALSQWAAPQDVRALPLPRGLMWLYGVVRLPSFVLRKLKGPRPRREARAP